MEGAVLDDPGDDRAGIDTVAVFIFMQNVLGKDGLVAPIPVQATYRGI